MPLRTVEAAPRASLLIESMRDIGYSLETAVADVIDNAITAEARNIDLLTMTDESSGAIGVLDDGKGMTGVELLEAMRIGCRSPLDDRPSKDLGRFGLGLKTASFSQCRRLTVVTRQKGVTSAALWDLDYVRETDNWLVRIPEDPMSILWADRIGSKGTLILWEDLDRLLERPGQRSDQQHFVRRVDQACSHLELVFHRFLSGEHGLSRVKIAVNGRSLDAYDPFATKHPATMIGPKERFKLEGEHIVVQAFTLPHHQHVTRSEWERQGGPGGYLKNQGFYVYREKRLILHGTWFGLARQTELTKLARVRVDIPNSLDSKWKIDVRKASAQLPQQVKRRLASIIDPIVARSKRVFRKRGTRLVEEARLPLWYRILGKDQIQYRINLEHPVLAHFANRIPPDMRGELEKILELAGAAIPVDTLFADFGADPAKMGSDSPTDEVLGHAATTTFDQLVEAGIGWNEVLQMMESADPFRANWSRTTKLLGARRMKGR
jgi:hypothetical protein